MKGYYGLSKEDPLVNVFLKIPASVKRAVDHEAKRQNRYPVEVIRNIIIKWEKETRLEREEARAETRSGSREAREMAEAAAGGGKRKRA